MRLGVWLLVLVVSCTRAPLEDRRDAMRPARAPMVWDDLGQTHLQSALEKHAAFLSSLKNDTPLQFGSSRMVRAHDYARALDALLQLARTTSATPEAFYGLIRKYFEFHEVYGQKRWGEIRLTSYYEAELRGSPTKTERFPTPLLSRPPDLVEVPTARFDSRLAKVGALRGRLWRDKARGRDVLLPYHTRAEIHSGALRGRGLELVWVDPIEAFFMQIQGSGTVVLPGEQRLRLGYSDQNGHRYHSIGKFLTDSIALEDMSLFTIERHLKSLSPEAAQKVLNRNPSYIFFEQIQGAPKTSLGNEVIAGRTLATDPRFFPKGALAYLEFEKPVFPSAAADEPVGWQPTSRFVLDQDTGGAIKGGGRADLFWGSGPDAKRYAGFIKGFARLYYLVPKAELLDASPSDFFAPVTP